MTTNVTNQILDIGLGLLNHPLFVIVMWLWPYFLYTLHCQSWCVNICRTSCHGWSWFKHGPKSVHFTFMLGFKVLVTFAYFECNYFFRESSRGQAWNHKCPDETTDQMFGENSLQADRSTLGGTKKATRYTYLSQWQDQPGGAALCSYCCNWRFASSSFNRKYSVDNPPDCQSCCLV